MLFSLSISLRSHTFRLRSYTFRRGFRNDLLILHTFLYVLSNPHAISEKHVLKSYVPIRSVQPSHKFGKMCTQIIRSYTFCATLPQIRRNLYSNHTFPYVLSNPLAVLAWSHTFLHVPVTFLHVPPSNLKKHIVFHTFLHVPCNSIAKSYSTKYLWPPVRQYRK